MATFSSAQDPNPENKGRRETDARTKTSIAQRIGNLLGKAVVTREDLDQAGVLRPSDAQLAEVSALTNTGLNDSGTTTIKRANAITAQPEFPRK